MDEVMDDLSIEELQLRLYAVDLLLKRARTILVWRIFLLTLLVLATGAFDWWLFSLLGWI